MATSGSFVALSLYFVRGEITVRAIDNKTVKINWDLLNEIYMPVATRYQWKIIVDCFEIFPTALEPWTGSISEKRNFQILVLKCRWPFHHN